MVNMFRFDAAFVVLLNFTKVNQFKGTATIHPVCLVWSYSRFFPNINFKCSEVYYG